MGRVIAFIPVRGGSKSIPHKNIKNFCGKPLVYWNLQALQESIVIDEIIVATDSVDIEDAVKGFDIDKVSIYRRLEENAADNSSTESVLFEYIKFRDSSINHDDVLMLVQATSPLTETHHFSGAIDQYFKEGYDSMLSCVPFKRFLWDKTGMPKNYDYLRRPRRQEFEGELLENGAFYINKVGNIITSGNRLSGKIGIFVMPEHTGIEIDEEDDWVIAESLMRKHVLSKLKRPKKPIKLFISDVDGVLTDAGMYYSENGDELKKFNTHDGMAFRLLREANIKTAIITSENTQIVSRRAEKLKVDYLIQGKRDGGKLKAALEICEKEGISIQEVAYVGDDVNCYNLLCSAGLSACPANAVSKIKEIPFILQLKKSGGSGAVREFVDILINDNL